MSIRKRGLVLTIFLIILLSWSLSYGFGVFDPLWISIFMALAVYVGVYWIVNFEVHTFGFITVLLPPAITVFFASYVALSGFSGFEPGGIIYMWVVDLLFLILVYVSLLVANVINTWTFKRVALAQVAATVFLFLSLITFYLALFSIMGFGSLIVLVIGSVGVGGFLSFCNLWLAGASIADSLKMVILLSSVMAFFAFVLFFWPIPLEVYSAALASIFFVSTGVSIHAKKKTLNFLVWLEYLFILLFVLVFLIATARWGIGGKL